MLKYLTIAMFALSLQTYAATATSTPKAPTDMRAMVIASTTQEYITLTWSDNSNNETNFALEKRATSRTASTSTASSSLPFVPFTTFAFTPANQKFYIFASTTPDTLFTFRVRAYNNVGYSAYSNEWTVLTSKAKKALPIPLSRAIVN